MTSDKSDSLGWSHDFVVLDARSSVSEAAGLLADTTAAWVVFHDENEETYFACKTAASLQVLNSWRGIFAHTGPDEPVGIALQLDRSRQSVMIDNLAALTTVAVEPKMHYMHFAKLGNLRLPIAPFLLVEGAGSMAIGAPEMERPASRSTSVKSVSGSTPGQSPAVDEGACPVRYPSIRSDQPPAAGTRVVFSVDALLEPDASTEGAALDLEMDDSDWQEHTLIVFVERVH